MIGGLTGLGLGVVIVLLAWAVFANAPFGFPNDGVWQGWMVATWAVLGLLILLWPVVELTARDILRKPQYAGSELELAWDDHCRSEALRSLYILPIALSGLTCFMAFTAVGLMVTDGSVREGAMDETLYVGLGMFAGSLLLAAAFLMPLLKSLARRPQQHVLRRLWAGTGFDPSGPARRGTVVLNALASAAHSDAGPQRDADQLTRDYLAAMAALGHTGDEVMARIGRTLSR